MVVYSVDLEARIYRLSGLVGRMSSSVRMINTV